MRGPMSNGGARCVSPAGLRRGRSRATRAGRPRWVYSPGWSSRSPWAPSALLRPGAPLHRPAGGGSPLVPDRRPPSGSRPGGAGLSGPFAYLQSAMTWQAVDGLNFAMVGGGGPTPCRRGPEKKGRRSPTSATFLLFECRGHYPSEVAVVRRALEGWGVTMVVVPDPADLPIYEQLHGASPLPPSSPRPRAGPSVQADAWVWSGVDRAGPPVQGSTERLTACGGGSTHTVAGVIERRRACWPRPRPWMNEGFRIPHEPRVLRPVGDGGLAIVSVTDRPPDVPAIASAVYRRVFPR